MDVVQIGKRSPAQIRAAFESLTPEQQAYARYRARLSAVDPLDPSHQANSERAERLYRKELRHGV